MRTAMTTGRRHAHRVLMVVSVAARSTRGDGRLRLLELAQACKSRARGTGEQACHLGSSCMCARVVGHRRPLQPGGFARLGATAAWIKARLAEDGHGDHSASAIDKARPTMALADLPTRLRAAVVAFIEQPTASLAQVMAAASVSRGTARHARRYLAAQEG